MWLSRLARFAHIEEVGGSSPSIPTKKQEVLQGLLFFAVDKRDSKGAENRASDAIFRPGFSSQGESEAV